MWNVTVVDGGGPGRQFDLLPVWRFECCSLKHIECFFTMMNVTGQRLARLSLNNRDDYLHIRARYIFSLQLLPVLRVQIDLSGSQAHECDSSDTNSDPRP